MFTTLQHIHLPIQIFKIPVYNNKITMSQTEAEANQQDKSYLLKRQLNKCMHLYTDKDQNIRHLFRVLLTSNQQLFQQINFLLQFCAQIRKSLQIAKQHNINHNQKLNESALSSIKQVPQIILKDVKNIGRTKQTHISRVANKLKVFVSKTVQKQSSKLKYNYNCYMSQILQQVNDFNFDEGYQKIKQQFRQIKKQFHVVNDMYVRLHRQHPKTLFYGDAWFYVSFYNEGLLFFQNFPLPFNSNLLFVPVKLCRVLNVQTAKYIHSQIDNKYVNQLNKQNSNWQNFTFEVNIKNTQKQINQHYFSASFQKKGLQNQTCSFLRKIRCFVYLSMLFNYLNHVLIRNELDAHKRQIKVHLKQKLVLEIRTQRKQIQERPVANPLLIKSFFKYFDQQSIKKRNQSSKAQITANFANYMLCTLAKIKYNIQIPQQYIKLKPKYFYKDDKRLQI